MVTDVHIATLQVAVSARIEVCLRHGSGGSGNGKLPGRGGSAYLDDIDLGLFAVALLSFGGDPLLAVVARQVSDEKDEQQDPKSNSAPEEDRLPVEVLLAMVLVIVLLHVAIMLHLLMTLVSRLPCERLFAFPFGAGHAAIGVLADGAKPLVFRIDPLLQVVTHRG